MENRKTGFIHTVFFWLRADLDSAALTEFEAGLSSLNAVETVVQLFWGKPAGTEREVVDGSYDYNLTIHFEDAAGQAAYQPDAIHNKFVEQNKDKWVKVQVYDTIVGSK